MTCPCVAVEDWGRWSRTRWRCCSRGPTGLFLESSATCRGQWCMVERDVLCRGPSMYRAKCVEYKVSVECQVCRRPSVCLVASVCKVQSAAGCQCLCAKCSLSGASPTCSLTAAVCSARKLSTPTLPCPPPPAPCTAPAGPPVVGEGEEQQPPQPWQAGAQEGP